MEKKEIRLLYRFGEKVKDKMGREMVYKGYVEKADGGYQMFEIAEGKTILIRDEEFK